MVSTTAATAGALLAEQGIALSATDRTSLYPDQPLVLSCPTSGLPYVYTPAGLVASGKSKRIIISDAAASHGGGAARWCVIMAPSLPVVQAQSPENTPTMPIRTRRWNDPRKRG